MRFPELCLCCQRGKCNSVPFSQRFQGVSSEASTEFAISAKPSNQRANSTKRKLAALEKAIMSIWPRLRNRQRSAKKSSKPNPYAGRGLDKFALVYAELAAKRESLAAQTGAPLSVVRFTAGSHSKWIPVFVSLDRSKIISERRSLNLRTSKIVSSDTILPAEVFGGERSRRSTGGAVSGFSLPFRPASFAPAGTEQGGTGTNSGGLEAFSEGKASDRFFLDKNGGQWPEIVKKVSFVAATLGALWIGKVAAVGATVTVALAVGVLLNKQQACNLRGNEGEPSGTRDGTASYETDLTLTKKNQDKHPSGSEARMAVNDLSQLEFKPQASYQVSSTEINESIAAPGSHESAQKASEKGDSKQHCRFKSKFLHKHAGKKEPISAPSSPRGATRCNFFSSTPSSPAKAQSSLVPNFFPVPPSHAPVEKKLKRLASHETLRRKSPLRLSSSLSSSAHRMKRPASRLGPTLTAVGLCITMLGLVAGRGVAVFMLVCWWYALPKLRQLAGDQRPSIRAHSDAEKPAQKINKSLVTLGSGKHDLHSNEYKKRVIMEGLLDRNHKSTT